MEPCTGLCAETQSLEPASDSVSASLSAPALLALCFSLCLSKINLIIIIIIIKKDVNFFIANNDAQILIRKNANTPTVKGHEEINQKTGNIDVETYLTT